MTVPTTFIVGAGEDEGQVRISGSDGSHCLLLPGWHPGPGYPDSVHAKVQAIRAGVDIITN